MSVLLTSLSVSRETQKPADASPALISLKSAGVEVLEVYVAPFDSLQWSEGFNRPGVLLEEGRLTIGVRVGGETIALHIGLEPSEEHDRRARAPEHEPEPPTGRAITLS